MTNAPSSQAARAVAETGCAPADAPAHEVLHLRLRRFDRSFRPCLGKLAERSSRLADLLYVFPGAAVELAAGKRSAGSREHIARLVEKGLPLAAIAQALGLPIWLKRLPPEAFRTTPTGLLRSDDFGRRIVNCLPASPEASALWFGRLTFALSVCDPAFALWLAGQPLPAPRSVGPLKDSILPLLPLAAYAWFSSNKETAAHALTPLPWHDKMTFVRAAHQTLAWLDRVGIELVSKKTEGAKADGDAWRRTHVCGGFRFTPLRTLGELREEGERMRNCLATYVRSVDDGLCLIYSLRPTAQPADSGPPAADLEVRLGGAGKPFIAQLRGAGNVAPPQDVVRAADIWLDSLAEHKAPLKISEPKKDLASMEIQSEQWEKIWRPYWEARPLLETHLGTPSPTVFARLHADATALTRWA